MLTATEYRTGTVSPRVQRAFARNVQLPPLERLALAKLLLESILSDTQHEEADWMALGLEAFQRDWDNDEDAIYDNWQVHYDLATW
jgi:hypothetical protein